MRDRIGTASIALFSLLSVSITIAQKIFGIETESHLDRSLTAISIFSGLFVIVISLIEWGAQNAVKADALFRSAEELNNFYRRVALKLAYVDDGNELTVAECEKISEEYERIKGRCPFNHDPVDDQRFVAEHRKSAEFQNSSGKPRISWLGEKLRIISSWADAVSYFLILWLIVVAMFFTGWITSPS